MQTLYDLLIGQEIKFKAQRIEKGNPVTGVLLSHDPEWFTVRLTKTIEGRVNIWETGEEKTFRKTLITGSIKAKR